MADEREIIWGDSNWRTSIDANDSGRAVVAETPGGTVLLEYDESANAGSGGWIYRGPVELNGNDVTGVGALDAASVSTEQITNGPIYAGNYDGSDVDSRLDSAIADASPGDEIRLERGTYSENRSISDGFKFVGTGVPSNDGTVISGNWTLNGSRTTIAFVRIDSDMTVGGFLSKILNSGDSGGVTVSISSDSVQVLGCSRFDVVFESGTTGGIVDGGVSQSVTDNGSNTEGDIA